jgi:hypothetical protein
LEDRKSLSKEKGMTENEEKREEPILARFTGDFSVTIGARKLLNGNKVRLVLEADYTSEMMSSLAPFMGKDARIAFKELASKKRRGKYGDDDGQPPLPGVGPSDGGE